MFLLRVAKFLECDRIENMENVIVPSSDAGVRLDRFLRELMPKMPVSHIRKLLRKGGIRVDSKRAKGELRLKGGELIRMRVGPEDVRRVDNTTPTKKVRLPFAVLHSDEDVLAIDKPSGLAMHAGSGVYDDETVVGFVREYLKDKINSVVFKVASAGRLDKGTSGVVCFGKTPKGSRLLNEWLKTGETQKYYLALVRGGKWNKKGRIDKALKIDGANGAMSAKSVVAEDGVIAISDYEVLSMSGDMRLIRFQIITGRTHQIRAHVGSMGGSIVGDIRYNDKGHHKLRRPFLHCERVVLPKVEGRKKCEIVAPLTKELEAVLREFSITYKGI